MADDERREAAREKAMRAVHQFHQRLHFEDGHCHEIADAVLEAVGFWYLLDAAEDVDQDVSRQYDDVEDESVVLKATSWLWKLRDAIAKSRYGRPACRECGRVSCDGACKRRRPHWWMP